MSLLDAAVACARQRLHVFPLHSADGSGRCSCGRADCGSAGKHPRTPRGFHDASCDESTIRAWWTKNPDANVGLATGASGLVVIDVDAKAGRPGLENWANLVAMLTVEHDIDVRDTCIVTTPSGGLHIYYRAGEHHITCSAGKLDEGIDVRAQGGYVVVPPSVVGGVPYRYLDGHGPERLRDLPDVLADLLIAPPAKARGGTAPPGDSAIPEGARNDRLFRDACAMRRRGHTESEILAALRETNRRCEPPLTDAELIDIVTSAVRYAPSASAKEAKEAKEGATGTERPWPVALGSAAFHGPLGDLVRVLEPHNEADPAALLVNTIVGFGSLVGAGPHIRVGADHHPARLFAALVGETAKARKGMSSGPPRQALSQVDRSWPSRVTDGLSTGEGLIWAVRDPVTEMVKHKERGEITYEEEITDHGVTDKRLFVAEGELARVLKVMSRPENTLSPVMRNAWDSGDLRILTKTSRAVASGAHISIVGHITREELLRLLTSTEAGNGFGNRFLWVCVRRSKVLPYGGAPDMSELEPLVDDLILAAQFASVAGELRWGDDARPLWESVYTELSEGRPGLVGALTARAEAQVLRLALIYALADCSEVILRVHLEAALEVWRYCAESASYIFGERLGDPLADEILTALRTQGPLDRTQISDHFKRHKTSAQIETALQLLADLGRATCEFEDTDGRSREVWRAL